MSALKVSYRWIFPPSISTRSWRSAFISRFTGPRRVLEALAANEMEAKLLQIQPGEPVCFVTTVAYTKTEEAVEYSRARYRGDRNKFSIDLYTE